jgi:hypothetical protein
MANSLVNALRTRDNVTENGMVTNSSSLSACVDLFFNIGAMRGQDKKRLIANFSKAFNENSLTALRTMFWARDVRGGAGERQIFKDLMVYLAENHNEALAKNLSYVPEYGRWDDLLVLFGTSLDTQAKNLIVNTLKAGEKAKKILETIDTLSEEDCQKILDSYQNGDDSSHHN